MLAYILTLGVRPLVIPDETRYALVPWEMIQSGDWAVPHLIGVRYFEKPVLGYWLNALSMLVLGENGWAIRLPSALSAGVCGLTLFVLTRRFFQDKTLTLLAPAIFLSMFLVYGIGTFAVLDMPVTAFLTTACACFFWASQTSPGKKRQALLALFGVLLGLAFMTKGFLAFAVPVVVIVPYMLWEGRWKELFTLCWTPLVTAALTILPWAITVHLREPDFWRYFFWVEHIQRFMSDDPQHPQPFWYFIPVLLAGAMPWTLFFPAFWTGIQKKDWQMPALRFALCWAVFPFCFFSASSGKLGTYILPCFPPLALLLAFALQRTIRNGREYILTRGIITLMGLLTLLLAGLWLFPVAGPKELHPYPGAENWKYLAASGLLLGWLACLWWAVFRQKGPRRMFFFIVPLVPLFLLAPLFFPAQLVGEIKAPGSFFARHADRVHPQTLLCSDDWGVRAVAWYYRRPDVTLFSGTGELAYGFSFPETKSRRLYLNALAALIQDPARTRPIVLIQKRKRWKRHQNRLPKPTFRAMNNGFVFEEFAVHNATQGK